MAAPPLPMSVPQLLDEPDLAHNLYVVVRGQVDRVQMRQNSRGERWCAAVIRDHSRTIDINTFPHSFARLPFLAGVGDEVQVIGHLLDNGTRFVMVQSWRIVHGTLAD
ncbi:hypothetical protein GIS00_14505 [Nakamurella sp. YIM 132087]|uniref:Uncharacterized protein n=1 Tax=Nakamurella alba TaxID=2665158 RepID=A0A7K1FLX5_9ACTN|nr:OB-fold nucleic acid binding domain-containing protein [Nakamurella alba]MTD15152.1 hypothetical protein [Nakamurella alba]